jgi:hypothetical protein
MVKLIESPALKEKGSDGCIIRWSRFGRKKGVKRLPEMANSTVRESGGTVHDSGEKIKSSRFTRSPAVRCCGK